MTIFVRRAIPPEAKQIRSIHEHLSRPERAVRTSEYFVAVDSQTVVGCAAVRMFKGGGYLYGLAVKREWQGYGIGAALTRARVEAVRESGHRIAVVLAMFWNVNFFRKLGFDTVRREDLPQMVQRLADFTNPAYKHSAVLWQVLAE